jgi:chloramphenicol 3-O-phosphotransferase
MISLVRLLKETQGAPKAIILAGAPGAGKSSVTDEIIRDLGLKVMNLDDFFIKNLRDAGISLDLKMADAEGRSGAAKAMAAAQKDYQAALAQEVGAGQNIVIDGTAAAYKKTESLKDTLEAAGYDVMMVYVYSSLEKSLRKNEDRFERSAGEDRSLMPSIVMQTWANVTKNFIPYLNLFGQNFVATTKDKNPFGKKELQDIINRYIEPFKPTNTKPKTEKEQAKAAEEKAKLEQEIIALRDKENVQKIIQQTVSIPEAQSKIKQFLNS